MPLRILDTNILYYLGSGRIKRSQICPAGHKMMIDPMSLIEITAKLDSAVSFDDRKKAIDAIDANRIGFLPTTTRVLVDLFGYRYAAKPHWDDKLEWDPIISLLSKAVKFDDLKNGIPFPREGVTKRLSLDPLKAWRNSAEAGWIDDISKTMETVIPKFSQWDKAGRPPGKKPHLNQAKEKALRADMATPNWLLTQMLCLQERAFSYLDKKNVIPPNATAEKYIGRAQEKLLCYCLSYSEYIYRLLTTGMMPQDNDSTDLELFLHLHDNDRVLVTADKRWSSIASAAGFGARIKHVVP